jgi:hypothetical protein
MVVAMARDIRVLLVKLCDRVDNMRTLEHMSHEAQERISRETIEIYAPLANRLGMAGFKSELEDLSFKYLEPVAYAELVVAITKTKRERDKYIAEVCKTSRAASPSRASPPTSGAREAPLLDLAQDEGAGVHGRPDPRQDRVPRARRERERLLRDARRHPLEVDPGAGALQGLHRAAEAEHVPVAPHDGHRPRARAHRDPDPHARDAPRRRARHRRALEVQGPQGGASPTGRAALRLAAAARRVAEGGEGPGRVPRERQGRPLPGRGLRLHAEGGRARLPARGDAGRLRVRDSHAARRAHHRRAHQRQARAAPLQAAQRRRRRGRDVAPASSRARTGSTSSGRRGRAKIRNFFREEQREKSLRLGKELLERELHKAGSRSSKLLKNEASCAGCSSAEGVEPRRRALHQHRLRQDRPEDVLAVVAPPDADGKESKPPSAARGALAGLVRKVIKRDDDAIRSTASTTSSSATPSAATRCRATTSSASSRAGAASRSTAAAVPRRSTPTPSAASRSAGTRRRRSTARCSSAW